MFIDEFQSVRLGNLRNSIMQQVDRVMERFTDIDDFACGEGVEERERVGLSFLKLYKPAIGVRVRVRVAGGRRETVEDALGERVVGVGAIRV